MMETVLAWLAPPVWVAGAVVIGHTLFRDADWDKQDGWQYAVPVLAWPLWFPVWLVFRLVALVRAAAGFSA